MFKVTILLWSKKNIVNVLMTLHMILSFSNIPCVISVVDIQALTKKLTDENIYKNKYCIK